MGRDTDGRPRTIEYHKLRLEEDITINGEADTLVGLEAAKTEVCSRIVGAYSTEVDA